MLHNSRQLHNCVQKDWQTIVEMICRLFKAVINKHTFGWIYPNMVYIFAYSVCMSDGREKLHEFYLT